MACAKIWKSCIYTALLFTISSLFFSSTINAQSVTRPTSLSPGAALVPASITNTATPTLDSEELAFLTLINTYRAQNGAGPLQVSIALENSSLWMSNDMATHNSTSHIDSSGRDAQPRISSFGYTYFPWGENIAGGFSDAQSVFNSWMTYCDPDSTGKCTYAHRQNMLNPSFVVIGIGRTYNASSTYGSYWVTDFGGFLDPTLNAGSTPPTISYFGASQYTIQSGQTSVLSWTTSGATSVSLDQGIGDVSAVTTKSVSPTQDTTYTLTARNSGGSSTAQVIVTTAQGCRPDLIQQNALLLSFPADIVCQTINKYFVADITYRAANGNCYETNVSGTTPRSCTSATPSLAGGQIPNVFDSTFNWSGANAQCWYTQGDTAGAPYGVSSQKICGLNSTGILSSHVVTILTPLAGSQPVASLAFNQSSISINTASTQNLTLTLSSPAPSGGLSVTLNSSNTSVATVPTSLNIAANASSLTVPVTGINAGSATITASAVNYTSTSATATIVANTLLPGLSVMTSSLANGQVGSPYSQTLAASGGTTPYSWSLMSGSMSGTMTLAANGQISGTPSSAVSNTPLAFRVVDSSSPVRSGTANLSLTVTGNVNSGLGIVLPSNLALNPGDQVTFPVVISTAAPAGGVFISLTNNNSSVLSLNTDNIFIPEGQTGSSRSRLTANGVGTATITASASGFTSASTQIQVGGGSILPPTTMSFSSNLAISGAVTQNLTLNLSAPAPSGGVSVTLSSSNSGVASVPSSVFIQANASSVSVPVTGVASGTATINASASNYGTASASVNVTVVVVANLSVTGTSLANGQVGSPYLQILSATGGSQPYSWTLTSGTLPAGLSLVRTTGQITGTPGVAVTNTPLTFLVTDSSSPAKTASGNFSLTIGAAASPASIQAAGGTPQSASPGSAFASPLVAIVRDSSGNPFSGATVTFNAPGSGASGSFAGGNTAITNSSGVATSSTFIANSVGGSYVVSASVAGVGSPAAFALTNVSGPTIVLPSTLTLNPGDQSNFPINLSSAAPSGGVFITLSNSNSNVATLNTTNIFIGEGQTSSTRSKLTGSAVGSTVITASASGFASASTAVQVGGGAATTMTLLPSSVTVTATTTQNLTLTLSSPAPAGGVTVTLSSSNTNVATVTPAVTVPANTTSASVTVTGVAAGSTNITASASGITSVNASVTVTAKQNGTIGLPANTSVTTGTTVALPITLSTAAPAGGVTVSLVSSDSSKAGVTANVFIAAGSTTPATQPSVNGIAIGSVTIIASASGYTSGSGVVQINAGAGTSSFSQSSLSINAGATGNLTLNLSGPAPAGGVTANLGSSNSGVAAIPSSVFFNAGTTSANVTITGVASGSATITANTPNFGTATASITIGTANSSSFSPPSLTVNAGSTSNFTLNLSAPAPSGGVTASISSSNTGIAAIPATAFFTAGTSSAVLTVTGVATGSATITANTPSFGTATASVTVATRGTSSFSQSSLSVNAGSTANLTLNLSVPAPSGGVTAAVSSSNSGLVTVPGSVFFTSGASSAIVTVTGVASGSATITANTPNYGSASSSISVASTGTSSFSSSSLAIKAGSTGNLTLTLSAPAPSGGLTATINSSNSGIATVPAVVNFAAGSASAIVTITGVASGSANITANTPAFGTATASVSVSASSSGIVLPSNVTLMPGQSTNFPVTLATAAPAGGVFISLSSDSPNVTVAPANIFINQGGTSASRAPTVSGINNGLANITATATGFSPATAQVQVGSVSGASMSFSPSTLSLNAGATQNLSLTLSAPPASALTVNLTSSNPGVATVPASVSFGANVTTASVAVTGLSAGSTTLTASASGLPSGTASVTVAQSAGIGIPSNTAVGLGQSVIIPVTLPTPAPANGVTVFLASSDTTKATVTPGVFIASGAVSPSTQPQVSGINLGSAVIVATASGYNTGSGQVQVTSSGGGTSYFLPSGLTLNGAVTQTVQLNLSGLAPAGLIVNLSSSNTAVAIVPTSINFPTGSTTVNIAVSGLSPGSTTITAITPNFGVATVNVTVSSLLGVTATWYGACWYPTTLYGVSGNFQAIDYQINASAAVTLQGSLFFSANCDPSGGIDNMNDYGSLTSPGHSIQGFSHHPDVIPSSAIYWIGPRTADGMCAPGSPCSGCVNYNRNTPDCGSLP